MTVTLTCKVCDRPHVATIAATTAQRPCPFCGAHAHKVKQGRPHGQVCVDCGEQLAKPAERCGWCMEQAEVLT